ncbi:hypothetical protein G5I_14843 [Acromyrmex echinatior]|uniref:Uncharacterized protein n=1 Tax=Acromyrmex echinatior TaxID=103372 RepID=F4X8V3_ACREC|nr:hypothetical protein G5I_14843 [Acromyrmex echinatior]
MPTQSGLIVPTYIAMLPTLTVHKYSLFRLSRELHNLFVRLVARSCGMMTSYTQAPKRLDTSGHVYLVYEDPGQLNTEEEEEEEEAYNALATSTERS